MFCFCLWKYVSLNIVEGCRCCSVFRIFYYENTVCYENIIIIPMAPFFRWRCRWRCRRRYSLEMKYCGSFIKFHCRRFFTRKTLLQFFFFGLEFLSQRQKHTSLFWHISVRGNRQMDIEWETDMTYFTKIPGTFWTNDEISRAHAENALDCDWYQC